MIGTPPFNAGCQLKDGSRAGIDVGGFVQAMFQPRGGFKAVPVENDTFKNWTVHGPSCDEHGNPGRNANIPEEWLQASDAGWLLSAENEAGVDYHAMVGNGVIGLETSPSSRFLFISGVFNGHDASVVKQGNDVSHRAAVWNPAAFAPAAPYAGNAGVALDLQRGIYFRRSRLPPTSAQPEVVVEQRLYAHRGTGSLLIVEYDATWDADAEASPQSVNVTFEANELTDFLTEDFDVQISHTLVTVNGSLKDTIPVTVWIGTTRVVETDPTKAMEPTKVVVAVPTKVTSRFTDSMLHGEPRMVAAAFRTSLDSDDPERSALEDLTNAIDAHVNHQGQLRTQHEGAWGQLWRSGFNAEGRLDVTQAVRSSTYYLLSSMRPERPFSLSPGGLASNGYHGHTFWDTETWMFPPLLVWYPEFAKSLLHYRWTRLGEARAKAKGYSPPYEGAMFPWESAAAGVETCPPWADTGSLEQHISADVALAARQYYRLSGDVEWLTTKGLDLASGIADFYASRAEADEQGRWHIRHIVPPDEFAHGVDDNPYTNFAAKEALLFAGAVADAAGAPPNPKWAEVANGLVILLDEETQRHPEYSGYKWGTKIKQADVVLLSYPLGMNMTKEQRLKDLETYAAVTDNDGPAMTWGMHALGYIEVGDDAKAAANFNRSFANVKPPFDVWTETPSGGTTNFLTGAGGFLQTVVFGYAGLRMFQDSITLAPKLIEGATLMEVNGIWYRSSCFSLRYDSRSTNLSLLDGEQLQVVTGTGREGTLQSGLDFSASAHEMLTIRPVPRLTELSGASGPASHEIVAARVLLQPEKRPRSPASSAASFPLRLVAYVAGAAAVAFGMLAVAFGMPRSRDSGSQPLERWDPEAHDDSLFCSQL